MVRGVQIFIILTAFSQVITGSMFEQFSTPEKKDKNKMLMYLRGILKGPTTVKVMPKQDVITKAPDTSINMEQLWDGNNLPDRSDKSKMLAYLRGIKAPSVYSVYEDPQHRGVIQTHDTTGNEQDNDDNQNPGVFRDTPQSPLRDPDAVTLPSFLPPVYHQESDSDTCFWRGQQSGGPHKLVKTKGRGRTGNETGDTKDDKNDSKKDNNSDDKKDKVEEIQSVDKGFEGVGDNVVRFFGCMQTKFWKSYNKLQKKICSLFEG